MNFVRAVQALVDGEVDFIVTGAWAAILPAPAPPRVGDGPVDGEHGPLRSGPMVTDWGVIDLQPDVAGVGTYAEAVQHSVLVNAFGRDVRTLDLSALIPSYGAGRGWQARALPELEALLEATGQS